MAWPYAACRKLTVSGSAAGRGWYFRQDHDCHRASHVAQNMFYLGTEIQTAFGRAQLHAEHQQIELATLGRCNDCIFGPAARGHVGIELHPQLAGKCPDVADDLYALILLPVSR